MATVGEPARRRSYPSVRSSRQFLVHLLRELSHISLHYEFLRSARDCPAHLFARSAYVAELAARSRLRRPHGSGDIVRLMQGRKRNKRREIAHHVVIDQHRLGTGDTAMDEAVADAASPPHCRGRRQSRPQYCAQRPNYQRLGGSEHSLIAGIWCAYRARSEARREDPKDRSRSEARPVADPSHTIAWPARA